MNSFRFFAGSDGVTASTAGGPPKSAMCVKSFSGSYGVPCGSCGAMTCEAMPETSNVYPSAGALTTCSEPSTPPAPGRFSTTKFSFSCSVSFCATSRPSVSALPPGANGATILTGRAGYGCALATKLAASAANAKRMRFMQRFYNRRDDRLHRRSHAHRPREFSTVRRQEPRRALAFDGRRTRVSQARHDQRQGLSHRGGRLVECAAARRGHGRHAHLASGDLADAGAPLVLAAARGRPGDGAL